jgi:serine/threonine protein kinase
VSDDLRYCPGCFLHPWTGGPCPGCGYVLDQEAFPTALHPGTVLSKYTVGRVLGRPGGFGITYLAYDPLLERRLALKELMPRDLVARKADGETLHVHTRSDEELFRYTLESFLNEARLIARHGHPNMVRVLDYFEANGTAYFAMEYYEGETLTEYVQRRGGRVPADEAVALVRPVMEALHYLHTRPEPVLHRDVKPANVYLARGNTPILLDFGAARVAMGQQSRSLSAVLSPGFAPYEQYSTRGNQGPWTDVYGCAATLYFLVAGKAPPEASERIEDPRIDPPHLLVPEVDAGLSAAIVEGLGFRPDDRPRSMEDFMALLDEASAGGGSLAAARPAVPPPLAPPPPPVPGAMSVPGGGAALPSRAAAANAPPSPAGARKRRAAPLLGAAAVLLLLVVGAGYAVATRMGGADDGSLASGMGGEITPPSPGGADETLAGIPPAGDDPAAPSEEAGGSGALAASPPSQTSISAPPPASSGSSTAASTPAMATTARATSAPTTEPARSMAPAQTAAPAPAAAESGTPAPAAPALAAPSLMVLLFGDEAIGIQQAESAILRTTGSVSGLRVLDATSLSLIRRDSRVLDAVRAGDLTALAALGQSANLEFLVVGELRADAAPSVNAFYSGTADLELRMYRISTGQLVNTRTFRVGSGGIQSPLATSQAEARSRAAAEAGSAAGAGARSWLIDALR